jgi:hypothetical protein
MSANNFSLKNTDIFNKNLNIDTNKIIKLYSDLIVQYFKFIIENKNIKTKNISLFAFIVTRGLDTITIVFSFLLYYTKNIDLTYFHSQKSFYFYLEFIGQISEDENIFLQLSSRDAVIYVYKKTIFEVNLELEKTLNDLSYENENKINNKLNDTLCGNETNNKLDEINFYINFYKTFLYKIIQNNDFSSMYIETLQNIYNKLNNLKIKKPVYTIFDSLIDKLFYKINNTSYFFEVSLRLINKLNKNPSEIILNKYFDKILEDEFNLYLDENNYNTFLIWFFN